VGHLDHLMKSDVAPQGDVRPSALPHRHGEPENLSVWIRARQEAAMSAGASRRFIEKRRPGPRSSDLPVQGLIKP